MGTDSKRPIGATGALYGGKGTNVPLPGGDTSSCPRFTGCSGGHFGLGCQALSNSQPDSSQAASARVDFEIANKDMISF